MSDQQLRDQALAELKLTTAGWRTSKGKENYPSGTAPATSHWGKAMSLLDQIGGTPPPPPPPPGLLLDEQFSSFDTTRWATKWWWNGDDYADAGQAGYPEEMAYRAANVTASGGVLSLTAKREATTDFMGRSRAWTSGMIQSGGVQGGAAAGFTFTYGLVEIRAKVPAGKGLWPQMWLCNANYTDYCSHEIDMVEIVSSTPNSAAYNYHYNGTTPSSGGYTHSEPLSNAYHVYAVEWRPTFIRWLFDGVEKQRFTSSTQITNVPHYIIVNLSVGGGAWPGKTDSTTPSPASMLVDYVRVSP